MLQYEELRSAFAKHSSKEVQGHLRCEMLPVMAKMAEQSTYWGYNTTAQFISATGAVHLSKQAS